MYMQALLEQALLGSTNLTLIIITIAAHNTHKVQGCRTTRIYVSSLQPIISAERSKAPRRHPSGSVDSSCRAALVPTALDERQQRRPLQHICCSKRRATNTRPQPSDNTCPAHHRSAGQTALPQVMRQNNAYPLPSSHQPLPAFNPSSATPNNDCLASSCEQSSTADGPNRVQQLHAATATSSDSCPCCCYRRVLLQGNCVATAGDAAKTTAYIAAHPAAQYDLGRYLCSSSLLLGNTSM
jgi:hypothetical protein